MTLADFDQYSAGITSLTLALDGSAPLIGSKSLYFSGASTSTSHQRLHLVRNVAGQFGKSKGRRRGLFQVGTSDTGMTEDTSHYYGFLAMQSAANITSTGTAYACVLRSFEVLQLLKITAGGLSASWTVQFLGQHGPAFTKGTVIALEFEWIADLDQRGGTQLTIRTGSATDYSDLAPVLTYMDTATPLLTSAGEGEFFRDRPGAGIYTINCRIDATQFAAAS